MDALLEVVIPSQQEIPEHPPGEGGGRGLPLSLPLLGFWALGSGLWALDTRLRAYVHNRKVQNTQRATQTKKVAILGVRVGMDAPSDIPSQQRLYHLLFRFYVTCRNGRSFGSGHTKSTKAIPSALF